MYQHSSVTQFTDLVIIANSNVTVNVSKYEAVTFISYVYLSRILNKVLKFWVLNDLQLRTCLALKLFYLNVTDESYVDETRVWRIKL